MSVRLATSRCSVPMRAPAGGRKTSPVQWYPWLLAALWLSVVLAAWRGRRVLRPLPPLERLPSGRVRVVVPVRDGARALDETLRSLHAQQAVDLRVTVVDDRSTDRTAEIAAAWAARDPRFEVQRIEALPVGWLGKPHACQRGAENADSEWLLFVDDDTWLSPTAVARALAVAEQAAADLLTLVPQLRGMRWSGAIAAVPLCAAMFGHAGRVDAGRDAMGVGAFMLVRTSAWRELGGHAAVGNAVVEDVALARRIWRAGGRALMRSAVNDFSVEWFTTLGGAFRALRKNFFAVADGRAWLTLPAGAAAVGAWLATVHAGWSVTPAGWAAAGALASMVVTGGSVARHYGWPLGYALWAPLGPLVVGVLLLDSTLAALRRGGTVWRGTFYSLAQVRGQPPQQ